MMQWLLSSEGRLVVAGAMALVLLVVRRLTAWELDWRAELGALAALALPTTIGALVSGASWSEALVAMATSVLVAAGWQATKKVVQ